MNPELASPAAKPRQSLGHIRPYSAQLVELMRALDAALIAGSLWFIAAVSGWGHGQHNAALAAIAAVAFILIAGSNDVYRSWRSESVWLETGRVVGCWALAVAIALAAELLLLGLGPDLPRSLAWAWALATPVLLAGSRIAIRGSLRWARVRGHNYRRTAVVGSTSMALRIAQEIGAAPWMGLKFAGCYDDRKPVDERVLPEALPHLRGNIDDLVRAAHAGDVDRVYITLPMRAELRIKSLVDRLSETPVTVLYVPDFFLFTMLHAQWEHVGSSHAVNVVTTPFLGYSGWTKRAEDIVLSSLILVLIALPLLVIALAVRLSSPGPVLFRQRRYGLNGKAFEIWKFRTMTVMEDGADFVQARQADPRVTRLGSFLRRTSLDELPQFINVLRGDMSIVGPRPHPMALDEQHKQLIPHYWFRHKIRPGITGLAQINGYRGPTDTLDKMEGRIQYDIEYIDRWSLLLDLKIIVLTIVRGFVHRNAF
ncbi:undecaprenyl-phosphate glucose phosphotransferase [Ideonella sp. DXS22W]|uniref:Undecaprenyl-phosphate glucose phosphotransferase n=1 Tax=Pseudaquabacterium inlustre TaxID=2984192 RepID=A0ABU9CK82_9BURK